MRSVSVARDRLSMPDSPLDAIDSLLSVGAGAGLTTYGAALVLGDVRVATAAVGLAVASTLAVLAVRSLRGVASAV